MIASNILHTTKNVKSLTRSSHNHGMLNVHKFLLVTCIFFCLHCVVSKSSIGSSSSSGSEKISFIWIPFLVWDYIMRIASARSAVEYRSYVDCSAPLPVSVLRYDASINGLFMFLEYGRLLPLNRTNSGASCCCLSQEILGMWWWTLLQLIASDSFYGFKFTSLQREKKAVVKVEGIWNSNPFEVTMNSSHNLGDAA